MEDRRKTPRLADEGEPKQPDAPDTGAVERPADRAGHVQVKDGRHNVWDTGGLEDTQQLLSFLDNPELALADDDPAPEAGEPGNPYNSTGGKALGWRKPVDRK